MISTMRGILFGTWLAGSVLAACLGACNATPQERTAAACTTLCRCLVSPLPAAQDKCSGQCEAELGGLPDSCTACIAAHADRCASLESECQNDCANQPPPPNGDNTRPDAGFTLVDAF